MVHVNTSNINMIVRVDVLLQSRYFLNAETCSMHGQGLRLLVDVDGAPDFGHLHVSLLTGHRQEEHDEAWCDGEDRSH